MLLCFDPRYLEVASPSDQTTCLSESQGRFHGCKGKALWGFDGCLGGVVNAALFGVVGLQA